MIVNLRDIGGIKTCDGKTIKKGLIFRSAGLMKLTKADVDYLRYTLNLKRVFDIRSDLEVNAAPEYEIFDVAYIHLPLIKETNVAEYRPQYGDLIANVQYAKTLEDKLAAIPSMAHVYAHMTDNNFARNNIRELIHELVTYKRGAQLFHCASGKDRTGIIAALLLEILGVSREDIVKDYMASLEASKVEAAEVYKQVLDAGQPEEVAAKLSDLILVYPENINAFLDANEARYDGREGITKKFLQLTDEEIKDFKARILE